MKKLSWIFWGAAILLSDILCAVVGYSYCDLLWSGRCGGTSAPASVAFLYAIPFGIGILLCIAAAILLRRKGK